MYIYFYKLPNYTYHISNRTSPPVFKYLASLSIIISPFSVLTNTVPTPDKQFGMGWAHSTLYFGLEIALIYLITGSFLLPWYFSFTAQALDSWSS